MLFFSLRIITSNTSHAEYPLLRVYTKDRKYQAIFNHRIEYKNESNQILKESIATNTPYRYLLSQSAQYDWDVDGCLWLQPFITNSYDKEALQSITQHWSIRTVGLMGSSHYRRVTNLLELLESGENSKSTL